MTGWWTYRTSAAGVIVLAAAAFTLSYDALHQLALDSRVRPALAWLWPVVIDGTIVVALLTVLAAKRASTRAGYPWALAGLFSAASVAFNIAHAPDRPVAQLVFAMARSRWCSPPTCSCNRSAGAAGRRASPNPCPYQRPAPNPHSRTPRPTIRHSRPHLGITADRLAHGLVCERPMRRTSTPARRRLVLAWPGPPASASATANACSPSSPPPRRSPSAPTATAGRSATSPITAVKGGDHGPAVDSPGGRRAARHLAAVRAPARVSAPHPLRQGWPPRTHRH
jgi:hypothetical protein